MQLRWSGPRSATRCAACGDDKEKVSAVEVHGVPGGVLELVRCGACASYTASRLLPIEVPVGNVVSYYLEQGAAIDLMAAPLQRARGARRLLEAGCGFGFALDFACRALKCEVLGVDPSAAARAGAAALGLPIRFAPLTRELPLGPPFDLALCSEVIEHVEDPAELLGALRGALAKDGLLWLTTPDADYVDPTHPPEAVLQVLSPGHHAQLFSRGALAALLQRAGFGHVVWEHSENTLRCWASPTAAGLARVRPRHATDDELLRRYLAGATSAAPPGSALELGFAYRHFKSCVNGGLAAKAEASLERLALAFERRHRIDLSAPEAALARIAVLPADRWERLEQCPFSLSNTLFFVGMLELTGRGRAAAAAEAFAMAAESAELLLDFGQAFGIYDGETRHLLDQSRVHHAIALARVRPAAAVAALQRMAAVGDARAVASAAVERARAQVLAELVNAQAWPEADAIAEHPPALDAAAAPDHAASTLFALGLLREHQGRPLEAAAWFDLAAAVARGAEPPGVLAAPAENHARRALLAARPGAGALLQTKATVAAPGLELAYELEAYWCDAYGLFLRGWAHAHEHAIAELEVSVGQSVVRVSSFRERLDLAARLPASLPTLRCGFEAYVAARAGQPVRLTAHTAAGTVAAALTLPARPLPVWPAEESSEDELFDLLATLLPPRARALFIGPRTSSPDWVHTLRRRRPDLRVIGVDIHPGRGVDLVADAHYLSCLRGGCFDLVLSQEVLEHLAAPWLVAAEANRVLREGGLVFQEAPYSWPAHAAPNDFWRISADGLEQLFGPLTGFAVVTAVNMRPAAVLPPPEMRADYLEMPIFPAYTCSRLIARKVVDLAPGAVVWPLDAPHSARRALSYPVDGLALKPVGTSP